MKNAAPMNENRAGLATAILAQQGELFELESILPFAGTYNPRELRIIDALMQRDGLLREELDHIAGCSNGPDLMKRLRNRGLDWGCIQINSLDRDGRQCKPGWYYLTTIGRRQVIEWQAGLPAKG